MAYVIVILIMLYGILQFDNKPWSNYEKKIWWYIELLAFILLWGLRYKVGGDSLVYQIEYQDLPDIYEIFNGYNFESIGRFQPLWIFFNAIPKSISDNFFVFQILHAIVVNSIIFWYIKKYSKKPFIMVLVYFFMIGPLFNTEILRESLAVCCFLIGYNQFLKNNWIGYYILAVLAFGFHLSAISTFFFPLFFYLFKKLKPRMTCIFIVIFVISTLSFNYVMDSLRFILSLTNNESTLLLLDLYSDTKFSINGLIYLIISLCLYLFFLWENKRNLTINEYSLVATYTIVCCAMISFGIFNRILNYLSIPFLIILINHLCKIEKRDYKIKYSRLSLIFLAVFLFLGKINYYFEDMTRYNNGNSAYFYNRYLPYESVFYPQENQTREKIVWNYNYRKS